MDSETAARIQNLKNVPGWAELVELIEHECNKYTNALAKQMLATGRPFDEFEYKRGYWAGMKAVLRYPDIAVRVLQRDVEAMNQEDDSE